ncbi:hypothetical protein [Oceanobacillus sp. J11TS1]|uniref:hypothetical protein n=1 Tax=Oceanobacillus sp. J11TS1 TaxID=2807191 RepID=UPI001B0AEED4|nr:hypothetical protein [Oceanobacillus sp. J11TS1]GIO24360.1 hypothetical protein J11TS1_29410 [Oceanobacillus sp. J11TS1]
MNIHIINELAPKNCEKWGWSIAIIAHKEAEVGLLARFMRAEAERNDDLGMLMVGNKRVHLFLLIVSIAQIFEP